MGTTNITRILDLITPDELQQQYTKPALKWLIDLRDKLCGRQPKVLVPCPYQPWDASGELVESSEADTEYSTVEELLDAYTGEWSPSYVSGAGKDWLRYSRDFYGFLSEVLHDMLLRRGVIDGGRFEDEVFDYEDRLRIGFQKRVLHLHPADLDTLLDEQGIQI